MRRKKFPKMNKNKIVSEVQVQLRGFTAEELKDIIGYIRSVEGGRPTRFVFFKLDTPELSPEESVELVKYLWPEEGGPPILGFLRGKES